MRSLAALSQPSFPAGVPGLVSTRACGCARPSALSCDEFATSVTEVCSARRTLARNRPQQAARAAQGTPAAPGAHRAVGTRRRRVRRALPSNRGQGGQGAGRLRAAAAWRPVRASWRRQQLCAVRAGRRLRLRRLVHGGKSQLTVPEAATARRSARATQRAARTPLAPRARANAPAKLPSFAPAGEQNREGCRSARARSESARAVAAMATAVMRQAAREAVRGTSAGEGACCWESAC